MLVLRKYDFKIIFSECVAIVTESAVNEKALLRFLLKPTLYLLE